MTGKKLLPAPAAGFRNTFSDKYVQQAQKKGLRSRAWFKLDEIQQSDKLFKPGMTVVDLGAAPGGWSQYAVTQIGGTGRIMHATFYQWIPSSVSTSFRATFVMN